MDQKETNSASNAELTAFENEKLSRRRALGRIGFLAGASAIAALTSDELLRKVGDRLAQQAGDNQVASEVAQEFQKAGVAFATPSNPCDGYRKGAECAGRKPSGQTPQSWCQSCCDAAYQPFSGCALYNAGSFGVEKATCYSYCVSRFI